MEPIFLLPIIFGICFVLLGRWLYKNPGKLFPGWGLLNPENPRVQKLSRIYATFLIFVGAFASLAVALGLIRSAPGMSLLAFPAAAVAAWFLRPKVPQNGEFPVAATKDDQPKNQPLLGKHWKRNLAVAGGFAALLMVVLFVILGDSDVTRMAIAAAESNPVVREKLGEPVKRGFFTSGNIEISGPSGHADLSIPVSGPRGKATIYAVAKKSAGLWKFESLDIAFDQTSTRMTLLKEEAAPPSP
ncbi:MAG: cytochrome c oxidase assembly factor Coa1 family protein [Terriglobales bacterium]